MKINLSFILKAPIKKSSRLSDTPCRIEALKLLGTEGLPEQLPLHASVVLWIRGLVSSSSSSLRSLVLHLEAPEVTGLTTRLEHNDYDIMSPGCRNYKESVINLALNFRTRLRVETH